jgi:hypothetical protein
MRPCPQGHFARGVAAQAVTEKVPLNLTEASRKASLKVPIGGFEVILAQGSKLESGRW